MFKLLLITTILIRNLIDANDGLLFRDNSDEISKIKLEGAQIQKWDKLTNIERNLYKLLEQATVWDLLQLHIAAWNDHLASIDRKIDIISRAHEKLAELETKLDLLPIFEYKIEEILRKLQKNEKTLAYCNQKLAKIPHIEATTHDIRAIVRNIENQFNFKQKRFGKNCKNRATINDISTQIDRLNDQLTIRNRRSVENNEICDSKQFTELLKCNNNFIKIEKSIEAKFEKYHNLTVEYFENLLKNRRKFRSTPTVNEEFGKTYCEDLDDNQPDGIYKFQSLSENPTNYHKNSRYCVTRHKYRWTIIQNRGNYLVQENFNRSWIEYRNGFGNLHQDFWLGNDLVYELTKNNSILRIELEDFDNNRVWCEFLKFKILSEHDIYRIIIGNYHGNASDSFTSHNGSAFSTFDRKNDQAPECCPCSVSYGGGWWFNSCFEANLNGIYHRNPYDNGHYGGLIWEKWLGDYSLKKSVMMIRPIEDP